MTFFDTKHENVWPLCCFAEHLIHLHQSQPTSKSPIFVTRDYFTRLCAGASVSVVPLDFAIRQLITTPATYNVEDGKTYLTKDVFQPWHYTLTKLDEFPSPSAISPMLVYNVTLSQPNGDSLRSKIGSIMTEADTEPLVNAEACASEGKTRFLIWPNIGRLPKAICLAPHNTFHFLQE